MKKQNYASHEQLELVEKQISDTQKQKDDLSNQYGNESNEKQIKIIQDQINNIMILDAYRVPELKKLGYVTTNS